MTQQIPLRTSSFAESNDLICACRSITRTEVEAVVAERGLTQLVEVTACLGAGSECGACVPSLREVLGDTSAWFEVEVRRQLLSPDRESNTRIERIDFVLPQGHRYPQSFAGQHITVQALVDGRQVIRSYTVIEPGVHMAAVSVAVRHQPGGELTPWLLTDNPGPHPKRVRISAPQGQAYWESSHGTSGRPTVCMVGGIGITLAMALIAQMRPGARLHLEYRARRVADHVFARELDAARRLHKFLTLNLTDDHTEPYLNQLVVRVVAELPDAQYLLCGPEGYVASVHSLLRLFNIPAERIHVEKFYINKSRKARPRSWKSVGYAWGAAAALIPAVLLWPGAQAYVPHGSALIGHEKLECHECHERAPGSIRQQLQAKVAYVLGQRESAAAFVNRPVSNQTCARCHSKSDDRHPSHRFLEPRFEAVRASMAPQRCASCHREHEGMRVTVGDIGFCSACHGDLELKADKTQPSHKELIGEKQWGSCLGCHDFHNNHSWKEPINSSDAIPEQKIRNYFKDAPSPYGSAREKAKSVTPQTPT